MAESHEGLVQIHRLTPRDSPEVLRARHLFDEPSAPEAVRAYLEDDRNIFLLAVDAGAGVGFLRGTALRQLKTDRAQMFLYEIAVAEKYRRRGIGRMLIEGMIRYCRDHDFEEIFVFTDPGNDAAVGLYRSTGGQTETPADRMYVYRL